jgi:hypothetical protein
VVKAGYGSRRSRYDQRETGPCWATKTVHTSLEYLVLHVYRLVRTARAVRDLTGSGAFRVDEILRLVRERFPDETAAIEAELDRLRV